MTKDIFNEGRVVGLSSYEEYVRQLKSVDADFDVCTEREWLAASLGTGSSMVLKVPANAGNPIGSNGMYIYQVEMPEGCHIGTGNTVYASYFYGKCSVDSKGWGTVVEDYGSLISNTESKNPNDNAEDIDTSTVPVGEVSGELSIPKTTEVNNIAYTDQHKKLNEYVKIVDGIVIQPGYWKKSNISSPYKDFTPDLHRKPVIRLTFMEQITNDFYIILTGFTNRSVLRGISKFDFGATETENKQDGDFLGCEAYPWACKIQFASSPAIDYLMKSSIRSGSRNVKIETYKDKPLIKVTSNNLLDTTVYSRQSNTSTTNAKETDVFGNKITTWVGTKDASHWYGDDRKSSTISQCSDPSVSESGKETVTTKSVNNPYSSVPIGFSVDNKYESDDRNKVKNGDHGGWYDIKIDPYRLIKDLIDEIFARFSYYDQRISEIENEIKIENDNRIQGDKYIINQMYNGAGGIDTLLPLLNEILALIYNNGSTITIDTVTSDVTVPSDYDKNNASGKMTKTSYKWKDNTNPLKSDAAGSLPRAKLNIYSGDNRGKDATDFIRSRADNHENDIHSK